MNDELDDINLLKAFKTGNAGAERTVFQRLYRPLCHYAESITGHAAAAEDLVQECVIKSWARRNIFLTFLDLQRFLYRIVHNAAVDYTRATRRHQLAHMEMQYMDVDGAAMDDSLDNEILRAELLQEIYTEIDQLPGRCKQIFKMIFFDGLSTDQIAAQLSLNTQTVRTQKARALQLLRIQLLEKGRISALLLLYALLEKI